MPPKVRITKDGIVAAAVDLVRARGERAINARDIAARLNCSTQPVFSNFATMEELKLAVVQAAENRYENYMKEKVAEGKYPPYKASGMAYIQFAKEEKELFKLLYMRDRSGEATDEESELFVSMEKLVRGNTGLGAMEAKLFHLEMWACVHGIAAMFATSYLDLDLDLVSVMLTDAYQGLKKHYDSEDR